MKVLLIYPCEMAVYRGTRFEFKQTQECLPPLNVAMLAGALREAGHEVRAIDLQIEPGEEDAVIGRVLAAWRPQMVGISFKTPLFDRARELAAMVRRLAPDVLLVGGGVHATYYPRECLESADFDAIVIGEGERTIVRLADGVPPAQIATVATKRDGEIIVPDSITNIGRGCLPGGVRDLDELPYPDWSVLDLDRYPSVSRLFYQASPVGFLETSRGCRAGCVFCCKGVFGSVWRYKSPMRVVDEMQRMLALGFREIEIVDDAFTTDLDRAVAVCEEILRRKLEFPWCCRNGLRVNDVDREFFQIARRAGLHLVAFGLETGNRELLAEMHKGATLEQGRRAARWARQAGLTVMGYFLMGLPGETEQTLQETIDYACSLEIDYVKYNLAVPMPGTRLHEMWKDRMKVTDWAQYNFHVPPRELYEHPNLDWDTLEAYLCKGYRRFYLRGGYLLRQAVRLLRQHRVLVSAKTAWQMWRSG
ncbi:MAG: cobalamin B12-binding domain-containing protein [Candidatus Nealsonbacteria bacterium]|nr:cobalamin B12-binding domain-containing protein [Candidatus Nealsonbacteria bacterium]